MVCHPPPIRPPPRAPQAPQATGRGRLLLPYFLDVEHRWGLRFVLALNLPRLLDSGHLLVLVLVKEKTVTVSDSTAGISLEEAE